MKFEQVIKQIKARGNPDNLAGMARYGIKPKNGYGVSMPIVRAMAKQIGHDHQLAGRLWASGIHDARILAGLIDEPASVTAKQMDKWAKDFYSWDVCDQVCSNLFDKTGFAYAKAVQWTGRKEEFVRRAGFVLMAALSVHDKTASDSRFLRFLPIIKKYSTDERNFVKKAVNWALRQIGKRNLRLNRAAIRMARQIREKDSRSARWITADALRELNGKIAQKKVRRSIVPPSSRTS
ncbi:MAG: DNA alkylation repair protein [Candidatus Brocadiia bacterium]